MAIYHCSLRVFSRSDGHSAVAAAAYRAGAVLHDERRRFTHRYHNRKGVVSSFILAPPQAPENTRDRALLWNAAEAAETRKNSRVAREVILALPHELTNDQRQALVKDMALYLVERYRVAVDIAIHSPVAGDGHDPRNHHAHLLFTTREITKDGLGKKTRVLDDKESGPQEVELLRGAWETLANDALARAGFSDIKIDRRTLDGQGIDRIPQTHIGPKAKASEDEAEQQDEEDEEGKKDGEDGKKGSAGGSSGKTEGDGKKGGKSGSGDMPPKISTKDADNKKREIDYKTIDQGRRRSDFVEEIKRLNERRAAFSDIPLKDQIEEIERLIERLDHRVHQLETLKDRTSLGHRIMASLSELVKLSKDLIFGREQRREAVKLSEQERATRAERQREHYGREYRAGLHEQIKTMRSNLDRLEQLKASYAAYKSFVEKIEKEVLKTQPSITTAQKEQEKSAFRGTHTPIEKIIPPIEFKIKLTLKADMLRESILPEHKPKDSIIKSETRPTLKTEINTAATPPKSPINLEIKNVSRAIEERAKTEPATNPADRKNWFIPASEKTRPLQESINRTIAEQRRAHPEPDTLKRQFKQEQPPKYTTAENIRAKIQAEAESKRANIPPQYQPKQETTHAYKSAFNTNANPDAAQRTQSKQANYEQMRERTRAEAQTKRENIPPEYRAEPYEQEREQPQARTATEPPKESPVKEQWKTQAEPEKLPNQEQAKPRQKMSNGFNKAAQGDMMEENSLDNAPDFEP